MKISLGRVFLVAVCSNLLLLGLCVSDAFARRRLFQRNGSPQAAEKMERRQIVDSTGAKRFYFLYQPKKARGTPAPLVLACHGGGGTARSMNKLTGGLTSLADREGFVVAFPQGKGLHWNDGRACNNNGSADVEFISCLIDELIQQGLVRKNQIFSTGISNGGFFSQYLAKRLSSKIAAVASVAATVPRCYLKYDQTDAVPVLFILGTKDPLVPYDGGVVAGKGVFSKNRGEVLSADESVRYWLDNNQNSRASARKWIVSDGRSDGMKVEGIQYATGDNRRDVLRYTVVGGGHTWPQGWQYLPAMLVGRTSKSLDANQMIWKFFQAHAKVE